MRPRLRLFVGDEEPATLAPTVTMSFGELTEVLRDAHRFGRSWLEDFSEDDVQIPEDLYEVLTAYRRLRPGA